MKILTLSVLLSIVLGACTASSAIIYEAPGLYGNIIVKEHSEGLRTLLFERHGARQSVVKIGDPDHLELSYARTVLAGLALSGPSRRMLVLGLGGGSLPMFLHKNYPESVIDVVEIDPEVISVAKRFFDVREDARLRIHLSDARKFVDSSSPGVYDLILVDAFGANSAPAHLTTQEFLSALRRAVSTEGVVIGNLWRRPFNAAYDSMVVTYQSVFEQNLVLNVPGDVNSILFAVPRKNTISIDSLATAAGYVERERRFRVDLEKLVRRAMVSIPSLKLNGVVIRDKDIEKSP